MSGLGSGASKTTITEETPSIRQIEGEETGVVGFVGITERGPVGVAMVLTSFDDYLRIFGGDITDGDTSHSVRGFFEEGGQRCWVVRTVHYTSADNPASKTSAAGTRTLQTGATAPTAGTVLSTNIGPYDLEPGDTIIVAVDGAGGLTATFSGVAPQRDSGNAPFTLSNGQQLTLSVNGGPVQTVTFLTGSFANIAAATAAEVAAVINASIVGASASVVGSAVRIKTDKRGTGASINITGGSANGALGYTTGSLAGTGNVADIDAVTVAEVKTVVEAAVATCTVSNSGGAVRISSNTTGGSSSVQVTAPSTADDELGLDNAVHTGSTGAAQGTLKVDAEDGSYSDDVTIKIATATSGVASEFDLQVLEDGLLVQTYPNLTMDEDGARYVETILNSDVVPGHPSGLTFTDLAISGDATARRPANGTFSGLTGGSDGLSSLADTDFIGSPAGKTGMYGLDLIDEIALLSLTGRATSAVHNAMISYCEVWRQMSIFPVLDIPAGLTAQQAADYVETTAAILGSSEFGAIYWPRVEVLNPDSTVFGSDTNIVVPNSGIVCGVYARTDASQLGGVYQPPAGIERGIMRSVVGFETDECLDERKRDIVFPKRINPLTTGRGKPRFIDGARTLKANGNFPSVPERRGVIFIEQSIKRGIEYVRHSNNTPELRRDVERTVDNFLNLQMQFGAFRSKDPKLAYFVDFGDGLNPINVAFAGLMIGRVGLATNKIAEFVELRFSQDTRAFDQQSASA